MLIKTLWGQRKVSYPGQYGPELITAWDENAIDGYEEGFELEVTRKKQSLQSEFDAFQVIDIVVDGPTIEKLVLEAPSVQGTVLK
jgi:hypothetical protein